MTASVTHSLPQADAGGDDIKRKLRGHIARRNLAGAANDCKWNELLAFMRGRTDWARRTVTAPSTGYVSRWDTEWDYTAFPSGVEWFDISLYSEDTCHAAAQKTSTTACGSCRSRAHRFRFRSAGPVARI